MLSAGYGRVQVLWDLSLKVDEGEFVALVGANGAGKTTLLKTISGVMRPSAGTITFPRQEDRHAHPNDIVNMGLSHIPESRKLFTDMSIRENLEMGAYPQALVEGAPGDHEVGLQALPASRGAGRATGADPQRRRAADAGHGTRSDVQAQDGASSTSRRTAWRRWW